MRRTTRALPGFLVVAPVALAVASAMLALTGAHRPPHFLAASRGYINDHSPWPTIPAADRLPVWPATVAVFIKVLPGADPVALTRRRAAGVVSGILYAVYPPALFLGYEGMSEPVSALCAAGRPVQWISVRRAAGASLW